MNTTSLGMIETHGSAAALEAADQMGKTADVSILAMEQIGGGLVTVLVQGDAASVKAAVEAAVSFAGEAAVASAVLPAPHPDLELILPVLD